MVASDGLVVVCNTVSIFITLYYIWCVLYLVRVYVYVFNKIYIAHKGLYFSCA